MDKNLVLCGVVGTDRTQHLRDLCAYLASAYCGADHRGVGENDQRLPADDAAGHAPSASPHAGAVAYLNPKDVMVGNPEPQWPTIVLSGPDGINEELRKKLEAMDMSPRVVVVGGGGIDITRMQLMQEIENSRMRDVSEVLMIQASDDWAREDIGEMLKRDFSLPYGRDFDKFIPRPDHEHLPEPPRVRRKYVSPVAEPEPDHDYYLAKAEEKRQRKAAKRTENIRRSEAGKHK